MRLSKGVTIYTHETPAVQRARGAQLGHGDQEMPPEHAGWEAVCASSLLSF